MIANAIGPIILHEKKERGKQTNLSESFTQSIHGQKKKKCCSE
jgi:flagellar assembly factor FliW